MFLNGDKDPFSTYNKLRIQGHQNEEIPSKPGAFRFAILCNQINRVLFFIVFLHRLSHGKIVDIYKTDLESRKWITYAGITRKGSLCDEMRNHERNIFHSLTARISFQSKYSQYCRKQRRELVICLVFRSYEQLKQKNTLNLR